jgi:2-hydroxy-3-oxopropionate reductase
MKLGFIGLGIMGAPMAGHLRAAGHELYVNTRSKVPQSLLDAGAQACRTPAEVARQAEVVFTMVPDTPDVAKVLFGDDGIAGVLGKGKTVVDMSSISPIETQDFARRIEATGADWLDAPVSGGEVGAKAASLTIMVGGKDEVFARIQPLLALMGKNITHVGPAGAGQITKVANQVIVALNIAAVGEALVFAAKAGADPARVRQALMGGFAASAVLGSARFSERLRGQPGARGARRTHDQAHLQPGLSHQAAPEGPEPRAAGCALAEPGAAQHRAGRAADAGLRRGGTCRARPLGAGAGAGAAGAAPGGRGRLKRLLGA